MSSSSPVGMRFFETAASRTAAIVAAAKAQDTTEAAVIATDLRGTIVYWSEHAAALYGWAAAEAIGRNVVDVTPTYNSSDEAERIMEDLRRGKPWRGQFLVKARDGTPIVAFVIDTPVRSGNKVIGIIGVSRRERRRRARGSGEQPVGG